MRFLKLLFRTFLYILIVVSIILLTISLKLISNLIAEEVVYNIIIVGEFLSILQIGEFVNVIVFAILGMGFGLASVFLPKTSQIKTSAVLLIILVPLIFSITPLLQYNSWIEEVADQERLSYVQAQSLTDSFLKARVPLDGFLGFYSYSAQFPVLPTSKKEMVEVGNLEKKVKAQFLGISKKIKLKPEIISGILAAGNWTIRFFYFSLSAFATITHFRIGRQELEKRLMRPVPLFPPVPPRYKTRQPKPIAQPIPHSTKPVSQGVPHRNKPLSPGTPPRRINK